MQGFSHITKDSCSISGRSNPHALSRASAVPTEHRIRVWGSLEDKHNPSQGSAPISPQPDGKESQAESAILLRASDTLEGGWEHQGEVCNWICVYFGPRLRSVHNEEVIRWLILVWALCWDKVSTVPTGKMWSQIARVQPYIIHFYSCSDFLDQVWEEKEHYFVVARGLGYPGFIHNVLIWIDRKTQY